MYEQVFSLNRDLDGEIHELTIKIVFEMEYVREQNQFSPSEGGSEIKKIFLVTDDGTEEEWNGSLTPKEEREFCQKAYEAWVEYQEDMRAEAIMDARENFHDERAISIHDKGEVFW